MAWDSSLHNSVLLNRVTPVKDWIYITITCYIELENFVQPACITKDFSLVFFARDARITIPRSLRSLIYGGAYKSPDSNKISAVYRLIVKQAADSGSPGAHRRLGRVIDTGSSYVRGEEMLQGWRPRSDSLIFEHQWELEKLTRLQQVEKTRHFLLLKSTIDSVKNDVYSDSKTRRPSMSSSSSSSSSSNLSSNPNSSSIDKMNRQLSMINEYESASYTDNQKQLLFNCIKLINQGRYIQSSKDKFSPNMSMSRSFYDFSSSSCANIKQLQQNNYQKIIPNINV